MTRLFIISSCLSSIISMAQTLHPSIPNAWDDSETKSFELPLVRADRSPKYPSAAEYYATPVRQVYRAYPFYVAGSREES